MTSSNKKWTRLQDYEPKDEGLVLIQAIIAEDKQFAVAVKEMGELLQQHANSTETALDILAYLITAIGADNIKKRDDYYRKSFATAISNAIYDGIARIWKAESGG